MELRVKDVCKEKGILMKDLAEKLGINRISLTSMISGNPTISTLEKISIALGVEVSELLAKPATGTIICPNCNTEIKLTAEKVAHQFSPL
jgi:transcriptional regulator with XRE-family HTH domain